MTETSGSYWLLVIRYWFERKQIDFYMSLMTKMVKSGLVDLAL